MSKIIGNISYCVFVSILIIYMYYAAYPYYLDIDMNNNWDAARDTVISYSSKG